MVVLISSRSVEPVNMDISPTMTGLSAFQSASPEPEADYRTPGTVGPKRWCADSADGVSEPAFYALVGSRAAGGRKQRMSFFLGPWLAVASPTESRPARVGQF